MPFYVSKRQCSPLSFPSLADAHQLKPQMQSSNVIQWNCVPKRRQSNHHSFIGQKTQHNDFPRWILSMSQRMLHVKLGHFHGVNHGKYVRDLGAELLQSKHLIWIGWTPICLNKVLQPGMVQLTSLPQKHHWLVVYLPLWKIWKSIGMIVPNKWKKTRWFCNPSFILWIGCFMDAEGWDKGNQVNTCWCLSVQLNKNILDPSRRIKCTPEI